MTVLSEAREQFDMWIASAAEAIVTGVGRLGGHQVRMVETDRDTFSLSVTKPSKKSVLSECKCVLVDDEPDRSLTPEWQAALKGSRLDITLRSSRFMFRPLDLPKRAADFLDGMVRSQIDRLTPWTAGEVVFNWRPPVEAADRIHLTVIAASKAKITPFLQLAESWEVGSVALYADVPDTEVGVIKVLDKRIHGSLDAGRVGRILTVVLLVATMATGLSIIAGGFVGRQLEAEHQQISHRISERRAALLLNAGKSADSAQTILVRRKQTTPSNVLVLEALSEILPDHTYMTELRIEKDKLQIVGITRDAPSLVKLIEQSPHFTRATFFAPTTRSSSDPGERFHVEARLKPYFGVRS